MQSNNVRNTQSAFELGRKRWLTYWVAALVLIVTFILTEAAVIARLAGLLTSAQMLAWFLAFILIVFGTAATGYKMTRRRSNR